MAGAAAPLKVGLSVFFQNPGRREADAQVWRDELRLANLAEPLGFDSVWATEHHFSDYMLSPSPVQFLSWVAGRTSRVELGTMVVVIPWHDPLRVAESILVLDHLSGGRVIFGMGRGAAIAEFERLRVPMGESRTRFLEAAEMILRALETGTIANAGAHYTQPAAELRPGPLRTFRGRTYVASLSPDSVPLIARLGLGIQIIPQKPWQQVAEELEQYREAYRGVHGTEPPPPIASMWVYCHEDEDRAREGAHRYIGDYYRTTILHYRFDAQHFAGTKDYEFYARIQTHLARTGEERAGRDFADLQVWGTPERCAERIREIQRLVGCEHVTIGVRYAGMPIEDAERNLRLFAEAVLPRLRGAAPARATA